MADSQLLALPIGTPVTIAGVTVETAGPATIAATPVERERLEETLGEHLPHIRLDSRGQLAEVYDEADGAEADDDDYETVAEYDADADDIPARIDVAMGLVAQFLQLKRYALSRASEDAPDSDTWKGTYAVDMNKVESDLFGTAAAAITKWMQQDGGNE